MRGQQQNASAPSAANAGADEHRTIRDERKGCPVGTSVPTADDDGRQRRRARFRPVGGVQLHPVPMSQKAAARQCREWHRHNDIPRGDVIRVGVATPDGVLVSVGFAGRPVAKAFDDGRTLEVTRVASSGAPNCTSIVYAALTRAGFALGYTRLITYTQHGESGASLRAAGYRVIAERPARRSWNSAARARDDAKYESVDRVLWEAS